MYIFLTNPVSCPQWIKYGIVETKGGKPNDNHRKTNKRYFYDVFFWLFGNIILKKKKKKKENKIRTIKKTDANPISCYL